MNKFWIDNIWNQSKANIDPFWGTMIDLKGAKADLLFIGCVDMKPFPALSNAVENKSVVEEFDVRFSWPAWSSFESGAQSSPIFQLWVEQTNATVSQLDKQLQLVVIDFPWITAGTRVGAPIKLTLIFNGSIRRDFAMPASASESINGPALNCVPIPIEMGAVK